MRHKRTPKTRTRRNKRRVKRSLRVESLDPRQLMTAAPWSATVDDGVLTLLGSEQSETVDVSVDNEGVRVVVESNGQKTESVFSDSYLHTVRFEGRGGNDYLANRTAIPLIAFGGDGNDTIYGGSAANTIFGGDGHDFLDGGRGNDRFYGEKGHDTIFGDQGNDHLEGGPDSDYYYFAGRDLGSDVVEESDNGNTLNFGSLKHGLTLNLRKTSTQRVAGNELSLRLSSATAIGTVMGTTRSDVIEGNSLGNVIVGNYGNDRIDGFAGKNRISGQGGNDSLTGGTGDDSLYGGDGNDRLDGGPRYGEDKLHGEAGDDELIGGGGEDTLVGGAGTDVLQGGDHHDHYKFDGRGLGSDTVIDNAIYSGNTLDFSKFKDRAYVNLRKTGTQSSYDGELTLTLTTNDAISDVVGSPYKDVISGNHLKNVIRGNAGNDRLDGWTGDDEVYGGDGDDRMYGRDGNDILDGEGGDNDQAWGGAGEDTFSVEHAHDLEPHDTVVFADGTKQRADEVYFQPSDGFSLRYPGYLYGKGDPLNGFKPWPDEDPEEIEADQPVQVTGTWLAGSVRIDKNPLRWAVRGEGDAEALDVGDVQQQGTPTCSFAAALAAVAGTSFDLASGIKYLGEAGENVFKYAVRLFEEDAQELRETWESVYYSTTHEHFKEEFSRDLDTADDGEFWTVLYQRAYLQRFGSDPRHQTIAFATSVITGLRTDLQKFDDTASNQADLRSALASGKAVTAGTLGDGKKGRIGDNDLYWWHAYTVVAINGSGDQAAVTLRNPWGIDIDFSDGRSADGVSDGYVTVRWEDFRTHFHGFAIGWV